MIVFTPHLTSPKGGEIFNLGTVNITWNRNEQPTSDDAGYDINTSTSFISYEIEYTDNYQGSETNWHTLKRRIPWTETSFDWVVGKMIKSTNVRLRIRAKDSTDGTNSDWSMSDSDFSINIFKLIPPAIVSPLPQHVYTEFVLIILDETLTKGTFNQKVRYTLEYSSKKLDISWTVIVKDIPVGQNVIRWDLDNITPSDDYVIRLTAKNAACLESPNPTPDQIARRFVYNLKIQQPGMFFIDTIPPQAVLDIEENTGITNILTHTVNVFADDATTEVEKIQLRECESGTKIPLGDVTLIGPSETDCSSIDTLLNNPDADFGRLIGKPTGFSAKTQWVFDDVSGLRKLEAILVDSGGNTSVQNPGKTFLPIFRSAGVLNDFIVILEQRDAIDLGNLSDACEGIVSKPPATYEVAYVVDNLGQYWVLEPFPRLIATLSETDVKLVFSFNNINYLFTYVGGTVDDSFVYRDDKSSITKIQTFPNALSVPNAIAIFNNIMYIGLANGELWSYNSSSFTLIKTFSNAISSLSGDELFLYVGLTNSSLINLYNGTEFFESDLEP